MDRICNKTCLLIWERDQGVGTRDIFSLDSNLAPTHTQKLNRKASPGNKSRILKVPGIHIRARSIMDNVLFVQSWNKSVPKTSELKHLAEVMVIERMFSSISVPWPWGGMYQRAKPVASISTPPVLNFWLTRVICAQPCGWEIY